MKSKASILLVLMLLVGICVLIYPSVSQYWNTKTQSQAAKNYMDVIASLKEEDFTKYFDEAHKYNDELRALHFPLADYPKLKDYEKMLDISNTGVMGVINIEKIGVELPIYHTVEKRVLDTACGHLEGTSLPIGGESTHCVLSAHRGLPHAKLFTDLDKVELGDTFTIRVLDQTFTYQVDQIKVVKPDVITDIYITKGEDYCTLLTCTPYGINSHRLLVRGTRIENAKPVLYITSNAFKIDSLVATPIVAAPILFVLFIILMVKYRKPTGKKFKVEEIAYEKQEDE